MAYRGTFDPSDFPRVAAWGYSKSIIHFPSTNAPQLGEHLVCFKLMFPCIFFALGVPIDIPDKSILFSFYFEANYGLPGNWNSSYYTEVEHFKRRSLDRRLAYDIITKKLENNGYSGKNCLLKTICEIAKYSLKGNGLLGDIVRILFAPSSSQEENLPDDIIKAEFEENCNRRYEDCEKSLLDIVSSVVYNDVG
ncbi:hypothetical protein HZH66_010538 [Vespula vulgaris]|uniref:Uncharacterized protein n=1 Tax=Vespula vulgaris TaxID=7454 RepID=A0A834JG08_VESVU|nr:hypothetical protein HZH66_010538 [Vespula vulgaris]